MATQTRNPTSDVSFTGTWAGSAGSRFGAVDDHPDSGNPIADGLTHGTTAGEGLMGFSAFSVPAGSSDISVQVLYYDFKNGSQACNVRARIRCNDTTGRDAPGGTHNPGNGNANIALRSDNYPTNPKSGAAWTVNDVNGVGTNGLTAFGLVSTDANPTITVSSIQLQVTYTPPVTGDGAATEPADGAAASGVVQWVGNAAATEPVDSASASGTVQWVGTMAATESPDVAAADGDVSTLGVSGDGAVVEAQDTASASGGVLVEGDLSASEPVDTVAASGGVLVEGAASVLETSDVADASAEVEWVGNVAATEPADSVSAQGFIPAVGDLALVEAQDSASALGEVEIPSVSGNAVLGESPDLASIDATCAWLANVVLHETQDSLSAAGVLPIVGVFAAQESPDFMNCGQIRRTRIVKGPEHGFTFGTRST